MTHKSLKYLLYCKPTIKKKKHTVESIKAELQIACDFLLFWFFFVKILNWSTCKNLKTCLKI